LLVVAPLSRPESWPTWDAARTALTRPDDGTLLIGAVQLVAWGAWATFTFSVVTELVATIRHVEVPSIPLLGWTQHAAATLLTTAGLLVTTSAPGLTVATQPFAFVASAPDHAHTDLTALPSMTTPGVTMTDAQGDDDGRDDGHPPGDDASTDTDDATNREPSNRDRRRPPPRHQRHPR